jgi:hypothetical protein
MDHSPGPSEGTGISMSPSTNSPSGRKQPLWSRSISNPQSKFIKSIICMFGILNRIITDNGSQFISNAFQGYCEDLGIKICYGSVAHPESNGQVERTNAEILKGLKTRTYDGLEKHGKKWIDELPCALWGNRTSLSRATRETSFFMVYGAEAVLPAKVTMGSLRVQAYDEAAQDQLRREDIDLVDERRWQSPIKNTRYCQALKRYQERFVRSRELQVDDLVLRRVLTREVSLGREGPFRVTKYATLDVSAWLRRMENHCTTHGT